MRRQIATPLLFERDARTKLEIFDSGGSLAVKLVASACSRPPLSDSIAVPGRTGPRPNASKTRAPFVCSYRRKDNKLSADPICFDPNCKSARSCKAAKKFIDRRDSGERAAKRARNERESRFFK